MELLPFLQHKALQLRIDSIKATSAAKSGHPTSCLSAADLVATLFFHVMRYDLSNPKNSTNDRFILSKGHAIPVVYAAYKTLGIISEEELLAFRTVDSVLEGHPTPRFAYNEAATGSLGQGLAVGVGMALQAKKSSLHFKTYVMMGDAEIAEGSVWEAANLASHYNLDNLISIIDCNRLGQSGESVYGHEINRYAAMFEAFGWHTVIIDGHNIAEIVATFSAINTIKNKPIAIIAKTIKGYGLTYGSDKLGFHGRPFKPEEVEPAISELKTFFALPQETASSFHPQTPEQQGSTPEQNKHTIALNALDLSLFACDKKLATRKAFGIALTALGEAADEVVVLDADVKNSTFTELFEKKYPERFVQCFVAEQSMLGIATGFELRGKIPFCATFAAFFSRAHDQIRMASIGRSALRICGSHAGVSIGEDGPSQMGLEDIALMRSTPHAIVLYPSDGTSTVKLVELMANYHNGISYLRTTRAETTNLYPLNEEFAVGGCKVLRQSKNDGCLIIGAGITLHEALKAHDLLKTDGVMTAVIDLYSIQPMDTKTIIKIAHAAGKKIVVVEDHYPQGGIGEAVAAQLINEDITITMLAVQDISRSGSPEDLLKRAEIDSSAIIKAVKNIL